MDTQRDPHTDPRADGQITGPSAIAAIVDARRYAADVIAIAGMVEREGDASTAGLARSLLHAARLLGQAINLVSAIYVPSSTPAPRGWARVRAAWFVLVAR